MVFHGDTHQILRRDRNVITVTDDVPSSAWLPPSAPSGAMENFKFAGASSRRSHVSLTYVHLHTCTHAHMHAHIRVPIHTCTGAHTQGIAQFTLSETYLLGCTPHKIPEAGRAGKELESCELNSCYR